MMRMKSAVFAMALTSIALACWNGGLVLNSEHDSIGVATMDNDGTITLTLRAEGEGGLVGDSRMSYRPGDPQYENVLHHIGGIRPGEEKVVPPWMDREQADDTVPGSKRK